jgi:uncharacterized protein
MLPEEIKKLQDLHAEGALSDEEFEAAKGQLINTDRVTNKSKDLLGLDLRNYLTLMHGSQFAGFIVPFAGLVAPIVLWTMAKDQYPEVDAEGKQILNWMISELIYFTVAGVLCFLLIGFLLLIPLAIASLVLPLIATIEASQGKSYKYPLTIEFIK